MNTNHVRDTRLPLKHDLTLIYALSTVIAVVMTAALIAGILFRSIVYPTEELMQSLMPSDVAVLFIGVPMLLVSMWLTKRGRLIGLLFWPGALFFVLYNYLVYVFAMPLNVAFLLHVTLVMLSAYTLIGLVASIDGDAVQNGLIGAVPERLAGGVLAGLGFLFFLRVVVVMIGALVDQTAMTEADFALHITDFLITPAWIICGVLLWRRRAFGFMTGLGLLFQASMLFIGLIILLVLQPYLTAAPFALLDVVVTFILGMICFVPLALFMRGVVSGRSSKPK